MSCGELKGGEHRSCGQEVEELQSYSTHTFPYSTQLFHPKTELMSSRHTAQASCTSLVP